MKSDKENSKVGAKKWLEESTPDQKLDDIDHITRTSLDGVRRWFASRILTPILNLGYYDESTGKIVMGALGREFLSKYNMGDVSLMNATTQVDIATSAGTDTLTVPAGHVYIVLGASNENSTRGTAMTLTFAPSGGTAGILAGTSGVVAQNTVYSLLGGSGAVGNTVGWIPSYPLIMGAGDVLTMTQLNFVAADDTDYYFTFIDITL